VPQGWTPDQIKQFQDHWDTEFAGDLAKRRRAKFVPGETAAKVVQTKEPQHKDDFDEWLARIICFAFSVPPQWATKVMNRATAENHSAQSEEEGLEPTKEWVKDLIDEIVAEEFASPDLELHWLDEDEGDPETVLEGRLKVGALTLNEMRDALGLDPFDNAAADRPMVLTATGFVPIEANAGAGRQESSAEESAANGQSADAGMQSAKDTLGKASSEDPEHPGWPAGTPGGRGGKFRPKDDDVSDSAKSPLEAGRGDLEQPAHYAALENQLNDSEAGSQHTVDQSSRYAATQVVVEQSAISSNQIVNATTATLIAILKKVMDGLERAPGMTPQLYGQLVHKQFANAVRAANIPGIEFDDVETTYSRDDPDAVYGSPGSIRTDVVLHDESGKIIAIYDVKTGKSGLTPARVKELLTETRADPTTTKVIELRFGRAIEKYVLVRSAWS
jgi:hypothetical protein